MEYAFHQTVTDNEGYGILSSVQRDGENVIKLFFRKPEDPQPEDPQPIEPEKPKTASYKTQYYLKEGDTYVLKEEVTGPETAIDTSVSAIIREYKGYECVLTKDTVMQDKVREGNTTVLRLYYDPVVEDTFETPTYMEEYWVEVTDDIRDKLPEGTIVRTVEIPIKNTEGGTLSIQIAQVDKQTYENQTVGTRVEVVDKSGEYTKDKYANYELIEVEIDGYPATGEIKEKETTTVYQIYIQKPLYQVEYYVEVDSIPEGADQSKYIRLNGKLYMCITTLADNYVSNGTEVKVADGQAGVVEGSQTELKAGSDKTFADEENGLKWVYSSSVTKEADATTGTVTRGGEDVILRLFYNKEAENPTTSTETDPQPAGDKATTENATTRQPTTQIVTTEATTQQQSTTTTRQSITKNATTQKTETEERTTRKSTTERKTTYTTTTESKKTRRNSSTGDETNIAVLFVLMIGSGGAGMYLRRRTRKKQ